jgi:integrase
VPAANGRTIRFEQKPIAGVTKADLEAIRAARRPHGIVGCNRLLGRLRHFFNWSVGEGFTDSTPFKRAGVSVVKLETGAEVSRTRRLKPGDEDRLLAPANPHLRSLIVAALTTGCRIGELLSLQWQQIRYDAEGRALWIDLPASKTKTNTNRVLPIGQRLAAELVMRRHAPDGSEHPPSAYVFGDETGGQSIKKAWMATVLRALGHASISTTSRYLATSPERLARALERLEGEQDDAIRPSFAQRPVSADRPVDARSDKSVN